MSSRSLLHALVDTGLRLPVPSKNRSSPGTMRPSSGYPAAASQDGNAVHGPSMKRVSSSNLPAMTAMYSIPPTSWSWSSGCERGASGLTWELVDLDAAELYVGEQVQRVAHQLLRRETKTEASEAPLPPPDLCVTALKLRRHQQDADQERAGDAWIETGLVFTTRHGTPIEPRNFNRSFDRRITQAQVSKITVHGARKTCGSLLAALEVHPRVAMQILRHSKIAVTMEIYTEVPSAATRAALKKLGQWLDT